MDSDSYKKTFGFSNKVKEGDEEKSSMGSSDDSIEYQLDENNIEVFDISFGFNQKQLIHLLEKRGDAIGNLKWTKLHSLDD